LNPSPQLRYKDQSVCYKGVNTGDGKKLRVRIAAMCVGDTGTRLAIQPSMKQPTNQDERNEDKKKPVEENPSHGIDPESKEPEMEVEKKLVNG
jgi:hypothetical protein